MGAAEAGGPAVSDPNANNTVTLTCQRDGRKIRVTARVGDELVHMDALDPTSARRRAAFAKAVQQRLPAADLQAIDAELLRLAAAEQAGSAPADGDTTAAGDELLTAMPEDIRREAETMLNDPQLVRRVVEDVETLDVAGERELTMTVYLIGVSRLLPRPLAGIVQGPSSSGKSYLIERAARLFPAEAVIHATQMTPQALFHMRPGALAHRLVVAGERSRVEDDERAEATRALREMLSSGKLTKLMPVKVEGNRIETVSIEQEGPIAYVESTTLAKVFDEDANRCLMLHTDERSEQTRRVVRRLADSYRGAGGAADPGRVVLRHHALQRMLRPCPVVVPFADRLAELFPCERVEARRAFPHLIGMVQAAALLHQRQRPTDAAGRLIATADDYHLARYLLDKPLSRLLRDGISDPAHRLYERLAERWPYRPDLDLAKRFTTTEVTKEHCGSKSAVRGWLAELDDAGAVELVEEGRGRRPSVWKLTGTPPADRSAAGLPTVAEVCGVIGCAQVHDLQLAG
jgi:hypothetical protein